MAEGDTRRRLRADASRGGSLADWLNQRLHRLSWRTPIHGLRLRGRYPLQLLDVPADPIPGRARAGRALAEGRMMVGPEQVSLDALARGGFSAAFADHLHSFAWARDLAAAVPREAGAKLAETLTREWLDLHAHVITDPAWRPDLWGWRILFWTAYAPYILGSRDADYRKDVLNTLARGARHLDRSADGAEPGLPRVAAWAGVIAAGLLIPGGDLRVAHGEAGIARALAQAMHEDGGLATRSPAMQLGLVELLAQLRAVYEVRARPLNGAVQRALARAVPALVGVTLGDGALSSWQAGGPASAARVRAAVAASGIRAAPLAEPRAWGYQRLAAGGSVMVIDGAPPPSGALVRGGCASTLAFELSDGPQRLVVNCGGGATLPPELAEGLRTTAAHSTLVLADTNSTALHPDGTLGKGVTEVELERRDHGDGLMIDGGHDGYVRRLGFRHRRRMTLATDGRMLSGEDRLVPAGRRRAPAATPFAIRFHLAPGVEAVLTAAARGALIRPPAGEAWQFRADGGSLAIEDSVWIDGIGRPQASLCLVLAGETPPDGAAIGWSLRKVR